jgi:hypothetical protein
MWPVGSGHSHDNLLLIPLKYAQESALAPFSGPYEMMTLMGNRPQSQLDNAEERTGRRARRQTNEKLVGLGSARSYETGQKWHTLYRHLLVNAAFRRIIYYNLLIFIGYPSGRRQYQGHPALSGAAY